MPSPKAGAPTHTPGPWEIAEQSESHDMIQIETSDGYAVADVRNRNGFPQNLANARLIAAAPDLLAALIGVVRVAGRATVEFDAARAAIAKATEVLK